MSNVVCFPDHDSSVNADYRLSKYSLRCSFFVLRAPVVVLLNHPLADVRSVANHLIWHVAVETMYDTCLAELRVG